MSFVVSPIMCWNKTMASVLMKVPKITSALQDNNIFFDRKEFTECESNILLNIAYRDVLGDPVRIDFVIRTATLLQDVGESAMPNTLANKNDKLYVMLMGFAHTHFELYKMGGDLSKIDKRIRQILLRRDRTQSVDDSLDVSASMTSFINLEIRKSRDLENEVESLLDLGVYKQVQNRYHSDFSRNMTLIPKKLCEKIKFMDGSSLEEYGIFSPTIRTDPKHSANPRLRSLHQLAQHIDRADNEFFRNLLVKLTKIFEIASDTVYSALKKDCSADIWKYEAFDEKFALYFGLQITKEYLKQIENEDSTLAPFKVIANAHNTDIKNNGNDFIYDLTAFFPTLNSSVCFTGCETSLNKTTGASVSMRIQANEPLAI